MLLTVVLEKTLESPLDCKEIQPVHPKGDQSWVFIGRTDVEDETPILWPPAAKSWLICKDPDAGKDWGQEKKGTTEDEMVGWHHRLNGHGSGWTPEVGDGQGGLTCCVYGVAKSLTGVSYWTELNWRYKQEDIKNLYLQNQGKSSTDKQWEHRLYKNFNFEILKLKFGILFAGWLLIEHLFLTKKCRFSALLKHILQFRSVQFSSVAHSCMTLCDPINCSMPGFPGHHQLPELTQTHVHWVSDAIQPSHPLSYPSPPSPNPSQRQSLFQ